MLRSSWITNTTREIISRLARSTTLQVRGRHAAHNRAQELRRIVWWASSEIRQSRGQSLLWRHVKVGRIPITERRLHRKTWVPLHVGLVREHGWDRGRIHLVNVPLRLDTLLDTECVKFIKGVLEHAAISS